jgi:hypothetical protein
MPALRVNANMLKARKSSFGMGFNGRGRRGRGALFGVDANAYTNSIRIPETVGVRMSAVRGRTDMPRGMKSWPGENVPSVIHDGAEGASAAAQKAKALLR